MDEKEARAKVTTIVLDQFAALRLPGRPAAEDDLRDAGLSSLALVELVFAVEEGCGVAIPDAEINPANFRSIADLARMVGRLQGRAQALS